MTGSTVGSMLSGVGLVALATLAGTLVALQPAPAPQPSPRAEVTPEPLSHGLFDQVQVYRPAGPVRQFVLMLSDTAGFDATDDARARRLAAAGAMVAGISIAPFEKRLAAESGDCLSAAGAFENLAHHLQAQAHLPTYLTPMLMGRGDGGAWTYALLAQSEAGLFGPTVSLGFCPVPPTPKPLCASRELRVPDATSWRPATTLTSPWVVLQPASQPACEAARPFVDAVRGAAWRNLPAGSDRVATAALTAAYTSLAARAPAAVPLAAGLDGLPVIETPSPVAGPRVAIFLSGDGGWAGFDKALAASLNKRGVSVVGFDSLRYFWSERTPESLAADIDRLVGHYKAAWSRPEVLLIGFSQGADVLPFALNRLSPAARSSVRLTTLISLGRNASFEFHVANWLGPSGDRPIAPEAQRLDPASVLCIHGSDDKESLCPTLKPRHAMVLALPGNHHLDGDYDKLARLILDRVPAR